MPYYDFQCSNEHITEQICSYSKMKEGIDCPDCSEKAERIYSVSEVRPTFGYETSIFNQREQHRKAMKGSALNQTLV